MAFDDHVVVQRDPVSQLAYALTAPFVELPDRERAGDVEYQRAYTKIHLDRQARVDGALLRAFALAPEVRALPAVFGDEGLCRATRRLPANPTT
ncbi:MAG: hypothetical protein IPO74_11215 [Thermomonas sp.]|nr:hypothetical protein [Thermomonas sp.]